MWPIATRAIHGSRYTHGFQLTGSRVMGAVCLLHTLRDTMHCNHGFPGIWLPYIEISHHVWQACTQLHLLSFSQLRLTSPNAASLSGLSIQPTPSYQRHLPTPSSQQQQQWQQWWQRLGAAAGTAITTAAAAGRSSECALTPPMVRFPFLTNYLLAMAAASSSNSNDNDNSSSSGNATAAATVIAMAAGAGMVVAMAATAGRGSECALTPPAVHFPFLFLY